MVGAEGRDVATRRATYRITRFEEAARGPRARVSRTGPRRGVDGLTALVQPPRFHARPHRYADQHVYAPRSRFLPEQILPAFERKAHGSVREYEEPDGSPVVPIDVGARLRAMWE